MSSNLVDIDSHLDIVFGLGASGPDAAQVFNYEKEIVKHVIELPKAAKTRFAVLDYHGGSNTLIGFDDFKDEQKLKNHIDTLSWKGDADSVNSLFMKALEVFDENRKSRKVLMLFINDGLNVDLNALRNSARKLNERGVKVVVVAIGHRVRNEEIGAITSGSVVRGKITESVTGVGDRTGTEVLKGNAGLCLYTRGRRIRAPLDTHAPRDTHARPVEHTRGPRDNRNVSDWSLEIPVFHAEMEHG